MTIKERGNKVHYFPAFRFPTRDLRHGEDQTTTTQMESRLGRFMTSNGKSSVRLKVHCMTEMVDIAKRTNVQGVLDTDPHSVGSLDGITETPMEK